MKPFASLLILALASCGTPTPQPSPSPSPTVALSPTPTATPACVIPPDDEPGAPPHWTVIEDATPKLYAVVKLAEPVMACPESPDVMLDALARALRDAGACAGVPITPSGKRADAVFVLLDTDVWESYHAVSYATGCWALGSLAAPERFTVWRYIE